MDEGRKRMSERVYKQTEEGDRDSENLGMVKLHLKHIFEDRVSCKWKCGWRFEEYLIEGSF